MSTELLLPQVTMPGLTFREWQTGDAPALARYMTRPEYNRWLAVKLQSVAEVDVILKRHLARQKTTDRRHFRLCAIDAGTGELIADGLSGCWEAALRKLAGAWIRRSGTPVPAP